MQRAAAREIGGARWVAAAVNRPGQKGRGARPLLENQRMLSKLGCARPVRWSTRGMTIEGSATEVEILKRYLAIMKTYSGDYSVTLKLSCFLGIIVIIRDLIHCKEKYPVICSVLSQSIHNEPWGVCNSKTSGAMENANVWGLILHVRDALCHPRLRPWNDEGELKGFDFLNKQEDLLRLSEYD